MVLKNVVKTVDAVYCRKSEQTEESAMKSSFEKLGGTYHQEGDYLLPNLVPPESISVGIWGQRRRHCLKTQRKPLYNALFLPASGGEKLLQTLDPNQRSWIKSEVPQNLRD